MSYEEYCWLKREIGDFVEYVFCEMKKVDFKSYALFLSLAQINKLLIRVQPYVPFMTEYPLDQFIDETRNSFLAEYGMFLEDKIMHPNRCQRESLSFDINLQMMIYTHIWESKLFLKRLKRMAYILANKGYLWDVPVVTINRNNKEINIRKGQLIKDDIFPLLEKNNERVYSFFSTCYDSNLRNAFAHSMYMIDIEQQCITTINSEFDNFEKKISFNDWEKSFLKIALFSALFPKILEEKREELMIEIATTEPHFIQYHLEYTDKDDNLQSVEAKLGLCNAAGYSRFQLYV